MMCPDVRSRFFYEEVTPILARIASIKIAEGTERLLTLCNHRYGDNRHGNIKNGFRVEARYCSATHMLDVQYEVPDVLVQDMSLLLEQVGPLRLVSDHLYSSSFQ